MLFARGVAACAAVCTFSVQAQYNFPAPEIAYFRSDWCPSLVDRSRLNNIAPNYYAKQGTCCIERAILPPGVTVEKIAEEFPRGYSSAQDAAKCSGTRPTDAEADDLAQGRLTYDDINARGRRDAEASAAKERDEAVARTRAALETAKRDAPSLTPGELCATWGHHVRKGPPEIATVMHDEMKRRKTALSADVPIKQQVRIGDSRCSLLASWGLPDRANRTVTASMVRIQHVYGMRYVYTVNDRVTAFQD